MVGGGIKPLMTKNWKLNMIERIIWKWGLSVGGNLIN